MTILIKQRCMRTSYPSSRNTNRQPLCAWSSSFLFLLLIFSTQLSAQLDDEIGDWKSYLPLNTGLSVAQSDDYIYYSTESSLIQISKEDNSVVFIAKEDGLSDAGISFIEFDPFNKQLIIVYENSNIDIYNSDGVFNVPDIEQNTSIIGSKAINDIYIKNAQLMYLATAFGIVEYRLQGREFGSTVFTDFPITGISGHGSNLYSSTDAGLFTINPDVNSIVDFNQWRLLGDMDGLPEIYEAFFPEAFNQTLYFHDGIEIYADNEGRFSSIYTVASDETVQFIESGNLHVLVGLRTASGSEVLKIDSDNNITRVGNGCIDRVRDATEDAQGKLWFADNFREFRVLTASGECDRFSFNSPLSSEGSEVDILDGKIVVASGGVTDAGGDLFSRNGIYLNEDGSWVNINENNNAVFRDNGLLNFYRVAFNSEEGKIIFGTFWNGIVEYDIETGESIFYDETNSALQRSTNDNRIRIADVIYDEEGRLWISNFNVSRPLVMRDQEGEWHSFSLGGNMRVGDIAIDGTENKWIVIGGNNGGVYVFNEGDDVSSSQDNSGYLININNSELTTGQVLTAEADREGRIWVGSVEGVVLFDCGFDAFDSDCVGVRRRVIVDSIVGFLLQTEEVTSIETDGADRKWFGTKNGLFLQSSDGGQQIAFFTKDNSPLLDNQIIDLKFDPENGRLFILSNRGLQSMRTASTGARRTHSSNVYAFPNPVPPGYSDPIAIRGLARDADVKITDINGRIVFETQALGGQAIWPGQGLNGNRVTTGVYLVFSTGKTSFGDPDSFVSKILFVD